VTYFIKGFFNIRNTVVVDILLLKFKVVLPLILVNWSVVLWRTWIYNWLALRWFLSSICFWAIFRINFSNGLPVADKELIGRKSWLNFGSLPGFGNVIIFAPFQVFGKSDSRRQWFNKRVRYTSDLLGRCLEYLSGIPPSPQAFLNYNAFTISVCHTTLFFQGVVVYRCEHIFTLSSNRRSWFSSHQ
jgi:hypothetical protein